MAPERVLVLAEADYRYGVGPLRIRVERIDRANPARYDGEIWYPIEGIQVTGDGTELRRREVLVRANRLLFPAEPRRPEGLA
jgi:hypothetical protein